MLWNNYSYEIRDGSAVLTEYRGEEIRLAIPARIGGYEVTEIATGAFEEYGAAIERIEVPPTVKKIDAFAFRMCMSLTELVLPEGTEWIGENILYVTSVSELFIPSTVRRIDKACELGDVSWEISPENPVFSTDGYALYRREETGCALVAVQKKDERAVYTVREGTERIAANAFEGQEYLKRLTLADSVRILEESAFESCQNLREVYLPEGLQEICADAFRHCVRLKTLCLPSTLREVGARALTDTFGWHERMNGLEQITVAPGNSVFYADEHALFCRGVGDATLIKYFGKGREYAVPGTDGQSAKRELSCASAGTDGVTLMKYFGKGREYAVPPEVSRIGESAFRRSGVRKLRIPRTVREVQADAFRECARLQAVFIEADDAVLYVPQTPVYRKDEVTELFYGKARKGLYDYAGYDRLIESWSQPAERCRMAAFRLNDPIGLNAENRESYERMLREHLSTVLADVCEKEDMDYLADLAAAGLFDHETIDTAIDTVSRCGRAKLTGYLMNYRQEHLRPGEFDFSL